MFFNWTDIRKFFTPEPTPPLSFFDKYEITSQELGSGTFGSVHLGKRSDGKSVAIKIIPIKHKEDCAREIEILKRLPKSLNVCEFIDSFEDDMNIYIVLEYIQGQNLYEYLKPHLGKDLMTIPFLLEILQQCAKALSEIHAAGIFHRDVKLENFMIMFDKSDKPLIKLIDFGLSDIIGGIRQECVGSAFWMSPEVIQKGTNVPISQHSDIWSIGMMMLELYIGTPMFSELNHFDQLQTVKTLSSPPIPQKLMDDTTAIGIWYRSLATMCLQIDPVLRITAATLANFSQTCSIPAA